MFATAIPNSNFNIIEDILKQYTLSQEGKNILKNLLSNKIEVKNIAINYYKNFKKALKDTFKYNYPNFFYIKDENIMKNISNTSCLDIEKSIDFLNNFYYNKIQNI